MKLNKTNSKKIGIKYLNKIKNKKKKEFLLIHSQKVGKTADLIARKMKIKSSVFYIAGWLHDIGYSKSQKNHAAFSVLILENNSFQIDDILKDCILNHGSDKNPKTIEGKIFQLADKLSIFDIDTIAVILDNNNFPFNKDSINFFKFMSESSIKLLKSFKK